jgi:hypothetical protein
MRTSFEIRRQKAEGRNASLRQLLLSALFKSEGRRQKAEMLRFANFCFLLSAF